MPETRVIQVDPDRPDPSAIAEAARVIRRGGLVAFAAETVYGLGADATNPEAVARIFEAKGRPATNPLIVHVADKAAALDCVSAWPDRAEALASRFWPGPLTMVLPRSAIIPDLVTAGQDTVGVRVPSTAVARWLIVESGRPIAAPSANRSTGVSPTRAEHVLKDLAGKVDLILDSGRTSVGIESTVLDLSGEVPVVLRPGEVTREQIAEALGEPVHALADRPESSRPLRSPGLLNVHYAPRTPTYRFDREAIPRAVIAGRSGLIVVGDFPDHVPNFEDADRSDLYRLGTPTDAASGLYTLLHRLDDRGVDRIVIVPPPDLPEWRAIRDRIWRASRPWPDRRGSP